MRVPRMGLVEVFQPCMERAPQAHEAPSHVIGPSPVQTAQTPGPSIISFVRGFLKVHEVDQEEAR